MAGRQFIGITDFTTSDQVREMLIALAPLKSRCRLGIGVMMSYKTLHGLPTKWSAAFPKSEDIADIFWPDKRVAHNTLHYADYEGVTASEDLVRALEYAGPHVHAVQLDMIWPDIGMVSRAVTQFKEAHDRHVKVILQVGPAAMEKCDHDPHEIAKRLRKYRSIGCLGYVLFDYSAGKGIPLDPEVILNCIKAARDLMPELAVIVAGGLGPDTLNLLDPILKRYPDISCDAQSKLHENDNALESPVDWSGKATRYLRLAAVKFESVHIQ